MPDSNGKEEKEAPRNNPYPGSEKRSSKKSLQSSPKGEQEKHMEDIIAQNDPENKKKKMEDSAETVLVLTQRPEVGEKFTIWEIDHYFHKNLRWMPGIFRYFLEMACVVLMIIPPLILLSYLLDQEINIKDIYSREANRENRVQRLFKVSSFFCTWYAIVVIFSGGADSFIYISGIILRIIQLYDSDTSWQIVQTAYSKISYLVRALSFFVAFMLYDIMFTTFHQPKFTLDELENVAMGIVLWIAFYQGLLFIVKVIVNLSILRVKQEDYKDAIIDINSKNFIFRKLKAISEARRGTSEYREIIEGMIPSYDTGLYLKYFDLFSSEDDARIVATNIFVLLKRKVIGYEEVKEFFPESYNGVYKYLTDTDPEESTKRSIKARQFTALAVELYMTTRDMAKSLRDRDEIYNKLELIFSIFSTYVGIIALLQLFQVNYKTYIASIGTTVVTFSWIFADSIKSIYNCFIFLLIVRPYNIGDRVVIEKEVLIVTKIDLFTTTFLSLDKKVVYIPNSKLIATNIANIARSPPQNDTLEISVDGATTYDQAEKVLETANKMLKEEGKMFTGCELCKLAGGVMSFTIFHTKNFQNFAALHARRDASIKIFRNAMKNNGVKYNESYVFM